MWIWDVVVSCLIYRQLDVSVFSSIDGAKDREATTLGMQDIELDQDSQDNHTLRNRSFLST